VRADEQQAGQGIGLAVVVDIVQSYEGEISVAQSSQGGADITVTL
jgi:two-component system sensor histidine kinase PhoQ